MTTNATHVLIHVKGISKKDDPEEFENKEGEGVALGPHLIYWWDYGRDGSNKCPRILKKLQEALGMEPVVYAFPVKAWWDETEIEAAVLGYLTMGVTPKEGD